ncbi:uncharacterized protein DUF927 [Rhodovulum adriaticum]|uniref:Uncharacterized protein DUF927 n=2 Tax=Rhodovulum adriaticum TaxID=35804 RepID=A0A4R2NJ28_RHOAD|nr:uncharacterized protein DUF927 [Rhodovulum adriaticum]
MICGPLQVASYQRSRTGALTTYLIRYIDRDCLPHTLLIKASDIHNAGAGVCTRLVDGGLEIFCPVPKMLAFLRAWRPNRHGEITDEFGWVDTVSGPCFALSDKTVLAPAHRKEPLYILGDHQVEPRASGELAAWKELVAQPSEHNPLMLFAISAALAGPLLGMLGLSSGGFNLHGRSSSGKTTALMAAMSVWNDPALLPRWHASPAGMELYAARSRDTSLILDDIPCGDPRALSELVYLAGNGAGKLRGNSNMSLRAVKHWRTVTLTTSEHALTDIFARRGEDIHEGVTVRLADIPAGVWRHGAFQEIGASASANDFSVAMKSAAQQHFGHAGPTFVRTLLKLRPVSGKNHLAKLHLHAREDLKKALQVTRTLEGPELRVLDQLAAAYTAALLADRRAIVSWSRQSIQTAMREVATLWFEARCAIPKDRETDIVDRLIAFLSDSLETCFANLDRGETVDLARHDGWHTEGWIEITTDCLKREVCGRLPLARGARALAAAGLIIPDGSARSLQRRPSARLVPTRKRVYRINRARLDLHARTNTRE